MEQILMSFTHLSQQLPQNSTSQSYSQAKDETLVA